jgi:hypothetical protein
MKLAHCLVYWIALSCLVLICGPVAYAQGNDAPEGVWESPDNRGRAVGIEVHKVKQEDGSTALEIGVYHRAKDGWRFIRLGDENFFDTGYSEGLLVIHFEGRTKRNKPIDVNNTQDVGSEREIDRGLEPTIDLNLRFDRSEDQWTGRFHRGSFDEQLVLRRVPNPPVPGQASSPQQELHAALVVVPNGTPLPTFEVELTNSGNIDLVLNLGTMLLNGREQFADAIDLSFRDAQNNTEKLVLKEPAMIAGRVDRFVVPLPKGAHFVLPIDLADYYIPDRDVFDIELKPGRYFLSAEYRGERVEDANLDMQGIRTMPYWVGRVDSSEASFVVPEK